MCTNATTQTNDSFACLLSEFTDSFLYMIFTSCSSLSCAHKCLHSLTLLLRAHPCAYTVDVSYRVTSSSILLRATISGAYTVDVSYRVTFFSHVSLCVQCNNQTNASHFLFFSARHAMKTNASHFLCARHATRRLTFLMPVGTQWASPFLQPLFVVGISLLLFLK